MNSNSKTVILAALMAACFLIAAVPIVSDGSAATATQYWTYSPTFVSTATDADDISWDFGDGTTVLDSRNAGASGYSELLSAHGGNVWNPRHTYAATGTYTVTQTVYNTYTDTSGTHDGTDTASVSIEIMGDPVVTFSTGDGSAVASVTVPKTIGTSSYTANKVTQPADPARDGYTFGGWYTDSGCTTAYDFDTPVSQSVTLYAKWNTGSGVADNGGDNAKWYDGHVLAISFAVAAVIALLLCIFVRSPYMLVAVGVLAVLAVASYLLKWGF